MLAVVAVVDDSSMAQGSVTAFEAAAAAASGVLPPPRLMGSRSSFPLLSDNMIEGRGQDELAVLLLESITRETTSNEECS